MSAAKTTATQWGLWRRSVVTLLAAIGAVSLTVGPGGGIAFGADPQPTPTPPATQPPNTPPASNPQLTPEQQRVENVIAAAKQYLGFPYRVGTEGPSQFDCSGLVFRAFSDAGVVDRIGNMRLRAAGYMRWFANRGQMTADVSQAQRGDLVIYNNGSHVGIYLGDGRVVSALLTGVTVHSLNGVNLPVTGFLRPDWSGDGKVPPFVPVAIPAPDVPETPATLVPSVDWMPNLDAAITAPPDRTGSERKDLRTLDSRTFENADGTFTTEFHAQPIFYQPAGTTDPTQLQPIDLTFHAEKKTGNAVVAASPVVVTTRSADDAAGLVTAAAGANSISLGLASGSGMSPSTVAPSIIDGGRVIDYFDLQPNGLGLRVLAQPDGFKSFLVLSKMPDKNRISFDIDAHDLTPALGDDGSVTFTDAKGATVGRIPRPLLLDSSDIDGNGGGIFAAATTFNLDTSGAAPVLSVVIDRSKLDEAVFPAYIDLSLTEFPASTDGADVSFVSSGHPNANLHGMQRPESAGFDELWLGHQPKSNNDNEVLVRFPSLSTVLGTVDVASAQLELLPYLQRSNDGVTVVRRVAADWTVDGVTWATKPATDDANALNVTSEAGSWSSLDVSGYVADVLSHGLPDFGLSLAGDDSTNGTWKRLAASDDGADAEFGPRLVVTWSGLRPTATATDPAALDAGTSSPTLAWTEPQLAGPQTTFDIQISRDNFATTVFDSGAVKGKNRNAAQWTVPGVAITVNGDYAWRVRVKYGTDKSWSPWSAAQPFAVTELVVPPHNAI
jgi:cell wall-associated NlpC family hydrolase